MHVSSLGFLSDDSDNSDKSVFDTILDYANSAADVAATVVGVEKRIDGQAPPTGVQNTGGYDGSGVNPSSTSSGAVVQNQPPAEPGFWSQYGWWIGGGVGAALVIYWLASGSKRK